MPPANHRPESPPQVTATVAFICSVPPFQECAGTRSGLRGVKVGIGLVLSSRRSCIVVPVTTVAELDGDFDVHLVERFEEWSAGSPRPLFMADFGARSNNYHI